VEARADVFCARSGAAFTEALAVLRAGPRAVEVEDFAAPLAEARLVGTALVAVLLAGTALVAAFLAGIALVAVVVAGTALPEGTAFFSGVAFFTAMLGPFKVALRHPRKMRTGGVRIRPSC